MAVVCIMSVGRVASLSKTGMGSVGMGWFNCPAYCWGVKVRNETDYQNLCALWRLGLARTRLPCCPSGLARKGETR